MAEATCTLMYIFLSFLMYFRSLIFRWHVAPLPSIKFFKHPRERFIFTWPWIVCPPLDPSTWLEDKMFRTSSFYKNHKVSQEREAVLQRKRVCPHDRLALGRSKSKGSHQGLFRFLRLIHPVCIS